MPNTRKYWSDRALARLENGESLADQASIKIFKVYDRALKNILKDVSSIYSNYSTKGILDVSELRKAISTKEKTDFLINLKRQSKLLGIDPSKVYDERYLSRLTRLEAISEQIKLEVMTIAPTQELLLEQTYREILQSGYKSFQSDLSGNGITPAFTTLDNKTTNIILGSIWKGNNYSGRVWNNTGKLAFELPTILGGALNSGQSYQKTAKVLRDRFDVGRYESIRLVRTETNYFNNQSDIQVYIDDGIKRYEFDAVIDSRTSNICTELNTSVFLVSEALVGVNYPPMHVMCRSLSAPVFNNENSSKDKPRTRAKRIERFKKVDPLGTKAELYRESMQNQMNPNKASHDYNADMNLLTQNYKGDELNKKLGTLMARIPKDYNLRPALEHVARLYGWITK